MNESSEIPDCVENSENFDISLDAAYYLFSVVHEQVCDDTLLGDLNLDGSINVLDIVTLVNSIVGEDTLDGQSLINADVNQDENINVLDVVVLVNQIVSE